MPECGVVVETAGLARPRSSYSEPARKEWLAGLTRMKSTSHWICLPEAVGRPPGEGMIQQYEVGHFIDLRQKPVGKTTTAGAVNAW